MVGLVSRCPVLKLGLPKPFSRVSSSLLLSGGRGRKKEARWICLFKCTCLAAAGPQIIYCSCTALLHPNSPEESGKEEEVPVLLLLPLPVSCPPLISDGGRLIVFCLPVLVICKLFKRERGN